MDDLRAHILACRKLNLIEVPCPEWGCSVWVLPMSGQDRDEWEATNAAISKAANHEPGSVLRRMRARAVVLCARRQDGSRIFGDEDVEKLNTLDARPLDRIYRVVDELSAISDEEVGRILTGKATGDASSSGSAAN